MTVFQLTALWGAPMPDQLPRAVTITGIRQDTPTIRSFLFDHTFEFTPGQFVMAWVPGVDEVPMALSSANSITVQNVGDATGAMFRLAIGDNLGLRGSFGNGFSHGERVLAIAGGVGAAPLLPVDQLDECTDLQIATDDGPLGAQGFVTTMLDDLNLGAYDRVTVCGPEAMMRAVLSKAIEVGIERKCEFSLSRYMKCGVGVCGSCCIDPSGFRVCRDGPVFSGDILAKSEFGQYMRDASGKKKPI